MSEFTEENFKKFSDISDTETSELSGGSVITFDAGVERLWRLFLIRPSPDEAMQGRLSTLEGIVIREQEIEDSARRGNIALKTIGVMTRSRVMFKHSARMLTAAGIRG